MQTSKAKATLIALFLVLMMAASLICLPTINAQTVSNPYKQMYIYVTAEPDPVGVGQQVLVVWWIDLLPPLPPEGPGSWSDFDRWHGITVTITDPNGNSKTMGPYTSDSVGGSYLTFVPETVGNYTFQAYWPGEWKNTTTYANFYPATTSEKSQITVQQEPLQAWPASPLPTGYWTRPINAGNREWAQIAGNWLADGTSNPALYTTAPNTAHIVWAKPIAFGGMAGGNFSSTSYYTGSAYEGKWSPPVIINGNLYYNLPVSDSTSAGGFMCVDLRTGQELYFANNTKINMGQIYDYESPNQHGTIAALWKTGNPSQVFDPFTGQWLYTITNVPSGTAAVGPDGSRLIYVLNSTQDRLALWNASSIAALWGGPTGTTGWQWRPVGKTVDGSQGYSWNVTLAGLPTTASITYVSSDVLIASATFPDHITRCGYSLKIGQIGTQLWSQNYPLLPGNQTISFMGPMGQGILTYKTKETNQWYAFDAYSGKQLWGPSASENCWNMYDQTQDGQIAYGKLYSCGMAGILYAYDLKTGGLLWTQHTDACELEAPYQYYPIEWTGFTIADGKIYIVNGEHSSTQPLYRGWKLYCFDANTGEGIWNITSLTQSTTPPVAVADGYLVTLNGMNNEIYCYGKGQTATTVSISPKVSAYGDSVLIEGTVTDQSNGAKDTPAIADDDMTAWMEYLYNQHVIPSNAAGVPVTLDTIDPNGNYVHIGNVTSDMSGSFSYIWTPEVPGKYTVIVTFQGSNSYFASNAETAIGVSEAAPTASPYAEVLLPPTEMYFTISTLAIIIAIAIIGVLLLRKKP